MLKFKETVQRFLKDDRGPTPVEWAAIAAVLITAIALTFPMLNDLLSDFFEDRVGDALEM